MEINHKIQTPSLILGKSAELIQMMTMDYPLGNSIVTKWIDDSVQEFIEDISSMQIKFDCDFPLSLFTSLEERVNKVTEYAKKI